MAAAIFRRWPDKYLVCEQTVRASSHLNTLSMKAKVRCLGLEFGWIQNVTVNLPQGSFEIGHFGVDTSMLKLGVGTTMMKAFQKRLKSCYGVGQVVFTGIRVGTDRESFLVKLGAVRQSVPSATGLVSYLW
jgi:hypothetical protein